MTTIDPRSAARAAGIAARAALSTGARRRAEAMLHRHLGSVRFEPHASIGVYAADDAEPDLGVTIERLRDAGHAMALPVVADPPDARSMSFRPWHRADVLIPGRFGIPVPPDRADIRPDVLLVPLVAFDSCGNRMGRGAGFYDRYLASSAPVTVGVAFETQRAVSLPVEHHDVPLDMVVTDLGVRFTAARRSTENRHGGRTIGKDGAWCE